MNHSFSYIIAILIPMTALTFGHECYALEPQASVPGESHFVTNIVPFVNEYCIDCHSGEGAEGGVDFERFSKSSKIQEEYELWEHVHRLIKEQQMPPSDSEQPTSAQLVSILDAINLELASFDCHKEKHPGRVTLRRLNRVEYNNTIRDLLGLDLDLAKDFPADDVGSGFDNIGDVLTIPPVLVEKYLAAAETIAKHAFENPELRKRIEVHTAESDDKKVEVAIRNIREFAERAYRRPLSEDEVQRIAGVMKSAAQLDGGIDEIFQTVVTAILTNPNFLFRVEQDPKDGEEIRTLNDFELASRLSYFLWSSMPDEELFALARKGELSHPDVISAQVTRMLSDPKSRALVNNFAGQWLQLRDVTQLTPDSKSFPSFNADLQRAMRKETEIFFEKLLHENRSLLEFLNADYTYLNETLAHHYGVQDVEGDEFRKVNLPAGRRGVLTHASILMLTSNPTRTSPVKRGKWILDNILAEPPPPPPPDVPVLEEGGEALGSFREQLEQHRADPSCASCHRTMDALGFGMENFDAIGAWRDREGRFDIDASGQMPGGQNFDGASELMDILVEEKKTEFSRCLTKKMLTYALGRGLESYDRCAVNKIVDALERDDYRFQTLIFEIVISEPFTMREARRSQ
ncbi:DUF1592 domain-containing protein [Thalassoglobus sp.]|uniref:DUF1592 domain-containing protein n=1 Tax=Thalassoglobus sp. TaxID=2795869 RepID=UPI003AA9AED6